MSYVIGRGRTARETYPQPPPAAAGAAPASAWGDSVASLVGVIAPTIVAHATITPTKTGKLRVWITGSVQNDSDSGGVTVTQAVGHGLSPATIDYTGGSVETDDVGGRERMTLSLVVDLDRTSTPITFTVGTPVQINAVLAPLNGQTIQWVDHEIQIAVQERDV